MPGRQFVCNVVAIAGRGPGVARLLAVVLLIFPASFAAKHDNSHRNALVAGNADEPGR